MKLEFYRNIIYAFYGRKLVKKLKKTYGNRKDWKIIVQATQDEEYLHLGNKYIADIAAEKSKKLLLIYDKKEIPMYSDNDIEIYGMSKRQIRNITVFYSMQKFAKDIIIYGGEVISTNKLYNLGKNGMMDKKEVAKIHLGIRN